MAWRYKEYSKDETLAKLEKEAREKKVGLWSDPRAVVSLGVAARECGRDGIINASSQGRSGARRAGAANGADGLHHSQRQEVSRRRVSVPQQE
jgi:hypothetical protein